MLSKRLSTRLDVDKQQRAGSLSHLPDSRSYLPNELEANDWFLSRGGRVSNSLVNKLDFTSFFSYIFFDR